MTKKAFVISPVPQTTHVRVHYEGGGEVPAVLQGTFTSRAIADRAIKNYWLSFHYNEPQIIDVVAEEEKAKQEKRGPGRPKKEIQPI